MEKFVVPNKGATAEVLGNWRKTALVVNAARRFRYVANLDNRRALEEERQRRKLKLSMTVIRAAHRFTELGEDLGNVNIEVTEPPAYGFNVKVTELAELVGQQNMVALAHHNGVHGLVEKLQTSVDKGLYSSNLDNRRKAFGTNTYIEAPAKGFWMFVWDSMQDLTLMILALCAVVSLVIGIVTEGWREGWYDGAGIAFSILLVVFVTATSDYRQSLQFCDLDKEKKKIFIEVVRDEHRQKISIFDLLVGDIVYVKTGDQLPADGLYISGFTLMIDESSMTGETHTKTKDEHHPFLWSGTKVQDGNCKMLVTGVGMNTEWGRLMATLGDGGDDETPLQVKLSGVATLIGKIGLGFAVLTFLVLLGRFLYAKQSLNDWSSEDAVTIVNYFAIAVTIIVVAIPEGLPLAVTLTLAFAMTKMMDDKALVRHLSACETMGSATTICTDKTGTLTSNEMTVVKAWAAGSVHEVRDAKVDLPIELLGALLDGAFMNCTADVWDNNDGSPPSLLGSPTETAILRFGLGLGGNFQEVCSGCEVVKMEPFNSTRKRMGAVVKHENGDLIAHWKGASEIVLGLCDQTFDANGSVVELDEQKVKHLKGVIRMFADKALRTLCLAFRKVDRIPGSHEPIPDKGFILAAIVGIKDPLRPEVKDAVRLCHEAGIQVRMVTGDNLNTAVAIAQECGIYTKDGTVIEGPVFRNLSYESMKECIKKLQVLARSSPTDKHTLVSMLQKMGEVVAVTGDGTNDAPALHKADIGLAMGIAGTEVAKESADVVILDDNFSTIVTVAKWGRSVYTNIQKFVQFQLTVNIVALVLNFSSACLTGSAPLTAVQLLWVNLIMDTLGALALATERPYDELMKRKPVGRNDNFISNVMWRNIIGQAVYQLAVLAVLQYMGKEILHLNDDNKDELLNTMIFNAFVFCQVFNEVNARDMEKVNVFSHVFNNKIFLFIVGFTVVFQFIMVQFLGKFANTVPLTKEQWLMTVSIGFVSLPIAALVKLIPVPKNFTLVSVRESSNSGGEEGDIQQPLLSNGG